MTKPKNAYLKYSPFSDTFCNNMIEDLSKHEIILLFKPGHYDILLPKMNENQDLHAFCSSNLKQFEKLVY